MASSPGRPADTTRPARAAGNLLAAGDAADRPSRSPPVLFMLIGDRVAGIFFPPHRPLSLIYSLDQAGQTSLSYVADVHAAGNLGSQQRLAD